MSNLTLKDRLLNFYRTRPLIVFGVLVCLAGVGAIIGMIVLVSIFQHKQEARNPFFRVVELTEEIEDPAIWGKNFPAAIRRLPPHGGPAAHALRRERSRAAHADEGRPALGRRAIAHRGGSALEDDVGRLRLREGFSRRTRARLHARRPDLHRAPAGGEAARHVSALPRVDRRCLTKKPATAI